MKRTTTRRRREMKHFYLNNRRLFPFIGLFLIGVIAGVALYTAAPSLTPTALVSLTPPSGGGWLQAFSNSCFSITLLLAALFLFGLWGCGAPFILTVPFLHGLGVGMTEAYYYTQGWGGIATAALLVMPVGLLTAGILCAAGVQSLRLSVALSRQLLTGETQDPPGVFRLYCLRFLLFLAAALAVCVLDVLLRGLWLPT